MIARANVAWPPCVVLALWPCLLAFSPATRAGEAPPEADFHVGWAERVFAETAPPETTSSETTSQNRLRIVHEGYPGDTKLGRGAAGGPLRLGEKVYPRGIGVNSHSVLRVELTRPAARLLADIGLDRNVDGTIGSAAFHVAVDGKDVFATEVLRPADGMQKIDVPLGGVRQFELIVDEGGDGRGYDQGDWADARVILKDGTELWLDDLAQAWEVSSGLPFSFMYDG